MFRWLAVKAREENKEGTNRLLFLPPSPPSSSFACENLCTGTEVKSSQPFKQAKKFVFTFIYAPLTLSKSKQASKNERERERERKNHKIKLWFS
jgi:hypothetical protein